ncbi:hypothetical protein GWI33_003280 [Rhynchophorus ferrugineus]|uniref:Uncharacterized protein n=1 Tax=Rhynchophorus ferrugineus TaxID=354439 RepID=A0A834IGK1_RHYFE|nr:hypothetical protein GWI33_003280 [Rhynchophorus ferrugineus]
MHSMNNWMDDGGDEPKAQRPTYVKREPGYSLYPDSALGSDSDSFVFKRLGTANWQVADVSNITYTSVISLNPVEIFYMYATRGYYQLPIKYSNGYILRPNIASNIAAKATDFGLKETKTYYQLNNGNVMHAEMLNFFKTSVNTYLGTWGGRFSLSPPSGYKGVPTPYRRNLNPFQ